MLSIKILLISLISTVIFGVIDAAFFLLGEETLQKMLMNKYNFDLPMAELTTGGTAAALAMFPASYISGYLHSKYTIIDSPILHSMGILMGTAIILLIYISFLQKKNHEDKNEKKHN